MSSLKTEREDLIEEFRLSNKDTGSPEVQIIRMTERIEQLTEHMKSQPKDYAARRGLIDLVEKRKKNLKYLRNNAPERYEKIVKELDL